MYLHEDCEAFRNLVVNAAQYVGTENAIVEKDYYVTLILRILAEKHENCGKLCSATTCTACGLCP